MAAIKQESTAVKTEPPNKPKVEAEQFRKIFVGGLTYSTTEDMLRDYYSQWGQVADVIIMRDQATRRSRGFGFVTYGRAHMVDECMSNRPHMIDGKSVEPKRAIPKDEASTKPESSMSVKKLYVSGIKDEHTSEMLHEYFKDFGDIIDVEIMTDKVSGKKRGFAFVTFDDYDAVDKAVLQKSHFINSKRCDVKKALSKEEMKKVEQMDRDKKTRATQSREAPPRDSAPPEEVPVTAPPQWPAEPAPMGMNPWAQGGGGQMAPAGYSQPMVRSQYGGYSGSTYGSAFGSQAGYSSGPSPWQGASTPGMQAAMNKAYYQQQQQQAQYSAAYGYGNQSATGWNQQQQLWPQGSSGSTDSSWNAAATSLPAQHVPAYGSSASNMRPWN